MPEQSSGTSRRWNIEAKIESRGIGPSKQRKEKIIKRNKLKEFAEIVGYNKRLNFPIIGIGEKFQVSVADFRPNFQQGQSQKFFSK